MASPSTGRVPARASGHGAQPEAEPAPSPAAPTTDGGESPGEAGAIFIAMSEFDSYLRGWQERWERQRRADRKAAGEARKVAERLARLLRDAYGARRVILVGSLARGEFHVGSDIDLAAEGIPDDRFFRAGADLEAAADGIHVDLVPIESADPAFLADLTREGIVLHEQRDS